MCIIKPLPKHEIPTVTVIIGTRVRDNICSKQSEGELSSEDLRNRDRHCSSIFLAFVANFATHFRVKV